jgi:hypothetical protein
MRKGAVRRATPARTRCYPPRVGISTPHRSAPTPHVCERDGSRRRKNGSGFAVGALAGRLPGPRWRVCLPRPSTCSFAYRITAGELNGARTTGHCFNSNMHSQILTGTSPAGGFCVGTRSRDLRTAKPHGAVLESPHHNCQLKAESDRIGRKSRNFGEWIAAKGGTMMAALTDPTVCGGYMCSRIAGAFASVFPCHQR